MTHLKSLNHLGLFQKGSKVNRFIKTLRNKISYLREEKTYEIEEDIDCEITDEIEKALWVIKEDLDLPTEEIEFAVDSRKKVKR